MSGFKVEVTSDIRAGNSGNRSQVVYIHAGGRYPVEYARTVWNGSEPLPAGSYIADRVSEQKYKMVLDLDHMKPAKA